MSETDSFINEVTAEVRRDRLYRWGRRYGWILALAIVAIVAGAAFVEWQASQKQARAEALGDAMLNALGAETTASRSALLSDVAATGEAEALRLLLLAGEQRETDAESAGRNLETVARMDDIRPVYRDLAVLRLTMIPDYPIFSEDKLARLETLTAPGAPLRLAALEQTAYVHAERNETAAAVDVLQRVFRDAEVSASQKQRVAEMIVALGGDIAES